MPTSLQASLIAHRHTCAASSIQPGFTRLLIDDSFSLTVDPTRWATVDMLRRVSDTAICGQTGSSSGQSTCTETLTSVAAATGTYIVTPRIRFNASSPVACWREPSPRLPLEESGESVESWAAISNLNSASHTPGKHSTEVEVCLTPVPVCTRVRRTVGAGDNISAGALRVQSVSRDTRR
ncbi:unnamed protein product [Protopolystoma xenopodis]|uniref:Uncharacterized protein n=1 Tax=Protopolystoma xenopodis TaxID=117903 RepID=A0A448XQN9_9PLAT|nr:unnamed protein product [Protopolystoma xenopodis]